MALICARGGSKGLPGKNLKILDGDPLVVRAIKQIKQIDRIDPVSYTHMTLPTICSV